LMVSSKRVATFWSNPHDPSNVLTGCLACKPFLHCLCTRGEEGKFFAKCNLLLISRTDTFFEHTSLFQPSLHPIQCPKRISGLWTLFLYYLHKLTYVPFLFFLISRTDTSFEHFCHFSPPCNQSYIPTGYLVHGPFSVLSAPKGENIYMFFLQNVDIFCKNMLNIWAHHLIKTKPGMDPTYVTTCFSSLCAYMWGGGGLNGRTDTCIGLD
jgi:hypothetical protein